MTSLHALHGSCSCGRNRYIVEIPNDSVSAATVFYDNSGATRRTHAAPLAAYLFVPLSWYHSSTHAFFPDETHTSIRRTYQTPQHQPTQPSIQRRQFCGYCGTHFSAWNESEPQDADSISIALESLLEEDVDKLEELGLLADEDDAEDEARQVAVAAPSATGPVRTRRSHNIGRGAPWFEEMVQDTRLGRLRRRRGGHVDYGRSVEWEITELEGDDVVHSRSVETSTSKRKIGDVTDEDTKMKGVSN